MLMKKDQWNVFGGAASNIRWHLKEIKEVCRTLIDSPKNGSRIYEITELIEKELVHLKNEIFGDDQ